MIRLSVDTSFEHLGLCISRDETVVAHHYSLCHRKNSKIIFNVLDELMKNVGIEMKDVDAFIVNQGPGSYTGVRIGMAVVKSFAQVMNKPVVPLTSLELIAGQMHQMKTEFQVLLNCTRKEVFYCPFKMLEGFPVAQTPIELMSLDDFLTKNQDIPVVLQRVSPDRRKSEPLFDELSLMPKDYPLPDAMLLDKLGGLRFQHSDFDANKPVHPLYIKRDVA